MPSELTESEESLFNGKGCSASLQGPLENSVADSATGWPFIFHKPIRVQKDHFAILSTNRQRARGINGRVSHQGKKGKSERLTFHDTVEFFQRAVKERVGNFGDFVCAALAAKGIGSMQGIDESFESKMPSQLFGTLLLQTVTK